MMRRYGKEEVIMMLSDIISRLDGFFRQERPFAPEHIRDIAEGIIARFWHLRIAEVELVSTLAKRNEPGYQKPLRPRHDPEDIYRWLEHYDEKDRTGFIEALRLKQHAETKKQAAVLLLPPKPASGEQPDQATEPPRPLSAEEKRQQAYQAFCLRFPDLKATYEEFYRAAMTRKRIADYGEPNPPGIAELVAQHRADREQQQQEGQKMVNDLLAAFQDPEYLRFRHMVETGQIALTTEPPKPNKPNKPHETHHIPENDQRHGSHYAAHQPNSGFD